VAGASRVSDELPSTRLVPWHACVVDLRRPHPRRVGDRRPAARRNGLSDPVGNSRLPLQKTPVRGIEGGTHNAFVPSPLQLTTRSVYTLAHRVRTRTSVATESGTPMARKKSRSHDTVTVARQTRCELPERPPQGERKPRKEADQFQQMDGAESNYFKKA
jgi:hypothetical protein